MVSVGNRSNMAIRGKLRSPGRPPGWQRDQQQRSGSRSQGNLQRGAAVAVGVASRSAQGGSARLAGCDPSAFAPVRPLPLAERREEIASAKPRLRRTEIARQLGADPRRSARAAAQCGDPNRLVGVSSPRGPVARGPTGQAPKSPNWRRTTRCASTSRTVSLAKSPSRAESGRWP